MWLLRRWVRWWYGINC